MPAPADQITSIARLLFNKRLLDIAGGNLSCRAGEQIFITPTGAGQDLLWDLHADDILCAPIVTDELMGHPRRSKESISHLYVYRAFPEVQAIIHAHPFHVMPYCAASKPMPAVILSAQIYGAEFTHIGELPMYSRAQAEDIVACLQEKRAIMGRMAAAVLMPRHGVFIAAASLKKAADCLERLDTNAYSALALPNLISP